MANHPSRGPDHAEQAQAGEVELRALSPRQQQILSLLRAGKVNKEIAAELGIGLGTVKQHVVALFKKLNVRNRAMAASRGSTQPTAQAIDGSHLTTANLLERRPCGVLSLILPASLPPAAGRLLQQTLAAQAFDHGAVFLARHGHAGDLIFGIQRAGNHDPLRLLRAARLAADALAAHDEQLAALLQCGVSAGLAIVSIERNGAWSGEAIASPAIAEARAMAHAAAPGEVRLDTAVRELLDALAPYPARPVSPTLSLDRLDRLPWTVRAAPHPMHGRQAEWAALSEQLAAVRQGAGRLVHVEGEVGMGKSLLCRHLTEEAQQQGFDVTHLLLAPDMAGPRAYRLPEGAGTMPDALGARSSAPAGMPSLIVVDNAHLLPESVLAAMSRDAASTPGLLIVCAARRFPASAAQPAARIRLGRLTSAAIELTALSTTPSLDEANLSAVVRMAAGVPLFAVQLARSAGHPLPLALRLVVSARLDRLAPDRLLLHQIARSTIPPTVAEIAKTLGEPAPAIKPAIDQAVAVGALRRDDQDRISFTHPLLRLVLAEALVD